MRNTKKYLSAAIAAAAITVVALPSAAQAQPSHPCVFNASLKPGGELMTPGYGIGLLEAVSFLPGGASDGEPRFDNWGGYTVFYEPFTSFPSVQSIELQPGAVGGVVRQAGGMYEFNVTTRLNLVNQDPITGLYCRTNKPS